MGNARPVKQRYYPVSKKLEQDMHRQVIEMLESEVIEPSTSAWSSLVVMIRKSNDKVHIDARPQLGVLPNSADGRIERTDGFYSAWIRPVSVNPVAVRPVTGRGYVSKTCG